MSKSPNAIIQNFLHRLILKQKYQEYLKQQKAAIKIQREFRLFLIRKEIHQLYINKCAQKIQRRYRKFLFDMKNNDARKNYFKFRLGQIRKEKYLLQLSQQKEESVDQSKNQVSSQNQINKPKTIIDLPPPWDPKRKNSYSQSQIDELLANQISDMKWVKANIIPKFVKRFFLHIQNRETVREKNSNFRERLVSRPFYTFVQRRTDFYYGDIFHGNIKEIFFHESTFRIFIIHDKGITIQTVNPNCEDKIYFYKTVLPILDASIDKNSGRLIILYKKWYISSFENGFFTKPQKLLSVPKPTLPQKKFIYIDKYGQLFLTLTQKFNTVYLLDSLCFSLLKKFSQFQFQSNGKVSRIFPVYFKKSPIGFFATSNSTSHFHIFDEKESKISTLNDHSKFTPNFYVNSHFVFTFSKDKKLFAYQRSHFNNSIQLTLLKSFNFEAVPLCVTYIKAMKLLVVGLSDSTLKFFTFSANENHLLTFPYSSLPEELSEYAEDVIGEPKTTSLFTQYNCILTKRLTLPPTEIHHAQFAQSSVLFIIKLGEYQVDTFWFCRKNRKVRCSCFDMMENPPIQSIPNILAMRKSELELSSIFESIEKVRNQLENDSIFLRTVGKEFEKRFLHSKFMRKTSEQATAILFQSPYRRWLRWLEYCQKAAHLRVVQARASNNKKSKKNPRNKNLNIRTKDSASAEQISIYEVYCLVNKLDVFVPSLNNVERFNMFLIETLPEIAVSTVGPFATTLGTTFSKDELVIGFDALHAVIGAQFTEYQSLKTSVLSLGLTIPSIHMKAKVRDFNEYAILRLTEIENIVRNKQRSSTLVHSIEEILLLGSNNDNKNNNSSSRNIMKSPSKRKVDDEDDENIDYRYRISFNFNVDNIPKIIPGSYVPIIARKALTKSHFVMPNPLFEAFRLRQSNELSNEYYSYGTENPTVQLETLKEPLDNFDEVLLSRSAAKFGIAVDVLAVSNECDQVLKDYPLNYVPLSYLLTFNQFKCGLSMTVKTALCWLSKILVVLCTFHHSNFVIRKLLPENILISNDGNEVKILSLSDFCEVVKSRKSKNNAPKTSETRKTTNSPKKRNVQFIFNENEQSNKFRKVSYECQNSPWLPPEYWAHMNATPAFDIYQFGILLVLVLTGFVPSSFGEIIAKHTKFRKEDPMEIAKSQRFFYDPLHGFPYSDFDFFRAKSAALSATLQISSQSSLLDIAIACLDIDPSRRPTAKQLLNLPFFNFNMQEKRNAENIGYSLIRKIPLPIFTDSIFATLFSFIEREKDENPREIPTLEIAVDIINYFINRKKSGIKIDFPIDESRINEVVSEIFRQDIFDKIVHYVIGKLQAIFEFEVGIQSDRTFTKIFNLFQLARLNTDVSRSFYYFSTGVRGDIDSHRLFCFLHTNLRKMVDFFLKNVTPEIKEILGLSEFYITHFMQFYDNSRDFAEAFAEKSERRHASALNFFTTFIENYPTKETMKLLIDFRIQHKIEQSLCFSESKVRIAALELCSEILHLECFDDEFFSGFLFHVFPFHLLSDVQPYEEKMLMICVIRDVFFSKSVPAIISLLSSGILDALIECSTPRPDRSSLKVWGNSTEFPVSLASRDLISELCERGITSVISVIYSDENMILNCVKNGAIHELAQKEFDEMINRIKLNDDVDDSLLTTLLIAESSSLATIAAVTRQSQQSFELSLNEICLFLIRQKENRFNYDRLFQSVLKICHFHKFSINDQLFIEIINGMENEYVGHVEMVIETLQILQKPKLPSFFSDMIRIWFNQISAKFLEIKKMISSKVVDMNILQQYKDERIQRLRFLKVVLSHPDHGLNVDFVTLCNFPSLIVNTLLFDNSKFEIKYRVVPTSFGKYNYTYPLRNEAIDYLREIIKYRPNCHILFTVLATTLKESNALQKEADMLKKINDSDFRRSSVRLLRLLSNKDDVFGLNQDIVKSEALKILKEISLYDWENVEMRRGIMDLASMKKNSAILGDIRTLYDSFIW